MGGAPGGAGANPIYGRVEEVLCVFGGGVERVDGRTREEWEGERGGWEGGREGEGGGWEGEEFAGVSRTNRLEGAESCYGTEASEAVTITTVADTTAATAAAVVSTPQSTTSGAATGTAQRGVPMSGGPWVVDSYLI